MRVFRDIATECGADRVFATMVAVLGVWSALSLALLAVILLDLLPRS
ncbi:hypothetical protein [Methylobacterium flocculans]|jgi:hypothetical protein|nr:hypothetical protein [Methylobacterium sp. FF17]